MTLRNQDWQRVCTARAWKRWSIAAAALLAGLAGDAAGQDSHYWATQYGNQSRLLAGAVIGSVADVSAVFYNPGALALIESAELLLSGNVFEYTAVDYRGLVGGEERSSAALRREIPAPMLRTLTEWPLAVEANAGETQRMPADFPTIPAKTRR